VTAFPAQSVAAALLGDTIYANMILLGFAWQKGLVPLERGAILRAIEINGASIEANKRAFTLGREAAVDLEKVVAKVAPAQKLSKTLDELIAIRIKELTAYQDAAYAERYAALVAKVRAAEAKLVPGSERITSAVARNLYKLMAIKDEYEVARLYTDGRFAERLKEQFGANTKLVFHMAPPLLSRRNPDTGLPEKRAFGSWMLPVLKMMAKGKRLRGTRFDIFGRTAERRMERELLADYERRIQAMLGSLTSEKIDIAVQYASVPDMIRGFGHVKEANAKKAAKRYAELEAALSAEPMLLRAAE
jgi:indolepyruvate ferredoxin oxidoreductase